MYLDPGFGSMVIQAVVGVIAVGGAALFFLRQKIAKFLGLSKDDNTNEQEIIQQETENDK